jgi:hypothetical protein
MTELRVLMIAMIYWFVLLLLRRGEILEGPIFVESIFRLTHMKNRL